MITPPRLVLEVPVGLALLKINVTFCHTSFSLTPDVDPHFSCAFPLDRRDSLFICEKLFSFGKVGDTTYFIFILKEK